MVSVLLRALDKKKKFKIKKFWIHFTDLKSTVFLILFNLILVFSVFITGKICIKQLKIINIFFSID